MTQALTRSQLLGIDDRKLIMVDVPEWGGCVYLRQLSVAEADMIRKTAADFSPIMAAAYTIGVSITDENGKRIFGDDEVRVLEQKNPKVVERLADQVARLNGWAPDSIEDAAKN